MMVCDDKSGRFGRFFALVASAWLVCAGIVEASRPAYRLTNLDPNQQTLTDVPLSGARLSFPNRTSRRASISFDGEASGSFYRLSSNPILPSAMTATQLDVEAGRGHFFQVGDLVRVGRTGELLSVLAVSGDVLNVTRGASGSSRAEILPEEALTIISRNTSFVCWYYCEQPEGVHESTVWELSNRHLASSRFALVFEDDGTASDFQASLGGWDQSPRVTLPFNPRGRWLLISLAVINLPTGDADEVILSVFDAQSGLTFASQPLPLSLVIPESVNPHPAPDVATIGNRYALAGESRNAVGICIPSIVADAIVDGRARASGVSTFDIADLGTNRGLSGPLTFHAFASCVWATNFDGGALGGNDSRAGRVDGTLHVFDRGSTSFPNRHQSVSGATLNGGLVSVDPYSFGNIARPPCDTTVESSALPASSETVAALGGLRPSGLVGPSTRRFADAVLRGEAIQQLRVGFFGNSRAVYPVSYPLQLSNGVFVDRMMMTNFVDSGVIGQAPIYESGLVVGAIGPIPWCNWLAARDTRDGQYAWDCSQELPRCVKPVWGVPTLALPSQVMSNMVDSTLGSRFGVFSRTATRVPSAGYPAPSGNPLDNFRGNHACVRLLRGSTARFMVRPELGLPETDSLKITLYVLNHPRSSKLVVRGTTAMSQGGEETSSRVVDSPTLGAGSDFVPPAPKLIMAVEEPVLRNQIEHVQHGSITVKDEDGAFAGIAIGDMVQVLSPNGVGLEYNEAFVVYSLLRTGDMLKISYEWLCRKFPAPGDQVTFIKGDEILKKVVVEFGAVAQGEWRGIELTSAEDGEGVVLWGIGYENPDKKGLVIAPLGRSGCGAWIQSSRWPNIRPLEGVSLLDRILAELDLDVLFLTTADQGTPSGRYVDAYTQTIDDLERSTPQTDLVLYGTGPEYQGEDVLDKSDAFGKFGVCAAMQYAAGLRDRPMTAWFFDDEYRSSAFGRLESGLEVTESTIHPSTVLDVTILARQLDVLPDAPPPALPELVTVCPSQEASCWMEPNPMVQSYQWEIEDPESATGFALLEDGVLVRGGVEIATISGSTQRTVTIRELQGWQSGGWARPGRARVRCRVGLPTQTQSSLPALVAVCPTDFDCSGGTDGDDVQVFFAAWDNGEILGDMNGDLGVDGDDVLAFFDRWDGGC